jgi:GT2 family glycosyltransferase
MSARNHSVGVVVVTRDRRDNVLGSLERLHSLPSSPPVVLVDNGSADGTVEQVLSRFPRVAVIEAGRNMGAAARNVGARALGTPYVAFSDDDSWWAPESLGRAADLFDRHPRLALLAARVLVGPEERLDPTCEQMARSPLPRDELLPGRPVLGFVACGAVVRRDAFLAAGGFEERFRVGGEERLVALDLASAGWALAYVPELVAHHHPDVTHDRGFRPAVEIRNDLWSAWLRRPLRVALRDTLGTARQALRSRPARAALKDALRGLPWALRRRRALPANVERNVSLLDRAR